MLGLGLLTLAGCAFILAAVVMWVAKMSGEEGVAADLADTVQDVFGMVSEGEDVETLLATLWALVLVAFPVTCLLAFAASLPVLVARSMETAWPKLPFRSWVTSMLVAGVLAAWGVVDIGWGALRGDEWSPFDGDYMSPMDVAGRWLFAFVFFVIILVQIGVAIRCSSRTLDPAPDSRMTAGRSGVMLALLFGLQAVFIGALLTLYMPWPLALGLWLAPAVVHAVHRAVLLSHQSQTTRAPE